MGKDDRWVDAVGGDRADGQDGATSTARGDAIDRTLTGWVGRRKTGRKCRPSW